MPWYDPLGGLPVWGAWDFTGSMTYWASLADVSGHGHGVTEDYNWYHPVKRRYGLYFPGDKPRMLATTLIPQADGSQSAIAQFRIESGALGGCIFGVSEQKERSTFSLGAYCTTWRPGWYFRNGGCFTVHEHDIASGMIAVAGSDGYINGVLEVGSTGAWANATTIATWLGTMHVLDDLGADDVAEAADGLYLTRLALYDGVINANAVEAIIGATGAEIADDWPPRSRIIVASEGGYRSAADYLQAALSLKGWRGTHYVPIEQIGREGCLRANELGILQASWADVACGAWSQADRYPTMTGEQVRANLTASLSALEDLGLTGRDMLSPPRQAWTKYLSGEGYVADGSFTEVNVDANRGQALPEGCEATEVRLCECDNRFPLAAVQSQIDYAVAHEGTALVLLFHKIVAAGGANAAKKEADVTRMNDVITAVDNTGLEVIRMSSL